MGANVIPMRSTRRMADFVVLTGFWRGVFLDNVHLQSI